MALLSGWFSAATGEVVHVDGGVHAMEADRDELAGLPAPESVSRMAKLMATNRMPMTRGRGGHPLAREVLGFPEDRDRAFLISLG